MLGTFKDLTKTNHVLSFDSLLKILYKEVSHFVSQDKKSPFSRKFAISSHTELAKGKIGSARNILLQSYNAAARVRGAKTKAYDSKYIQ